MEYNLEGLQYITGYDLSNEDKLIEQNIKSVQLISELDMKTKLNINPTLVIKKFDNIEERFNINYDEYYLHLRKLKINKIIKHNDSY